MDFSNSDDGYYWILSRIADSIEKDKTRKFKHGTSKKKIFSGSYDVWESDEDQKKYHLLMLQRLNDAKAKGLIINESKKDDWHVSENWFLTPFGEECLERFKQETKRRAESEIIEGLRKALSYYADPRRDKSIDFCLDDCSGLYQLEGEVARQALNMAKLANIR